MLRDVNYISVKVLFKKKKRLKWSCSREGRTRRLSFSHLFLLLPSTQAVFPEMFP